MQSNREPSDELPEGFRKLAEILSECGTNAELDAALGAQTVLMEAIAFDGEDGCAVDLQCRTADGVKIAASLMGIAVTALTALIAGTKKDPIEVFAKISDMVVRSLQSKGAETLEDRLDIPDIDLEEEEV